MTLDGVRWYLDVRYEGNLGRLVDIGVIKGGGHSRKFVNVCKRMPFISETFINY